MEVYGGDARTTTIAAKQGWWCLGPIDTQYNYELSKPLDRAAVLDIIDKHKSRQLIIGFLCAPWSRLTEWVC